jgi:hypothetical protein
MGGQFWRRAATIFAMQTAVSILGRVLSMFSLGFAGRHVRPD